ncbi:MAG: TonB-dependent receptor [Sphingomonadales bacterium]|nr:TonB-dependent receptor [Sphingomonadales bacterium]
MKAQLQVSGAVLAFALAAGSATPALAQATSDSDARATGDIIVTAQRIEQRLQDVPISMTVYSSEQLSNRNISVATDLANYTPSLSVNARYGPEKATFAIRGFNQDQSTAPTVGVYFADVVGPRAQGGTSSGNSVGAGSFTDLQNVQVLKGPQGTLFGRNTTGGSVLLVPKKPTSKLEGYVEGNIGNYNQREIQAAINIPLADTFKVRFAMDRNKRDGYMINHSGVGPKAFNDVNYEYYRASIVGNLTPDLENYTIFHYSNSHTYGYAAHLFACNPASSPATVPNGYSSSLASLQFYVMSNAACDQINRAKARGDGVFDVDVGNPDPYLKLKQWQAINTTTWQASDNITVKNIVSYGQFTERTSFSLNSDNFFVPNNALTQSLVSRGIRPGAPVNYILLDVAPGRANSNQSTLTEELQLQGHSEKLDWVVGGYLESSKPLGFSAGQTSIYGHCADTENLVCDQPIGFGVISASRTEITFNNKGIFAQGTYKASDKLSITLGARYTFDKITGFSDGYRLTLIPNPASPTGYIALNACNDPRATNGATLTDLSQCRVYTGETFTAGIGAGQSITTPKSSKPTWLVNVEYKPLPDVMTYAKYARGYRQGGLNFTNPGLETWNPEKLDSFELGAKWSVRGAVHGYVNVAAFYNNFTNQQIFGGLVAKPTSGIAGGAAIINAGKSKIYGFEWDSSLTFWNSLRFDVGYTYLHTKIEALVAPTLDPNSPFQLIIPNGSVGDPLGYSPKHKLTITGTYTLPIDKKLGDLSIGATYTYQSKQYYTTGLKTLSLLAGIPNVGLLPHYALVNLNVNWNNIAGSPIDAAFYATNLGNKAYRTAIGQSLSSIGFENALYGAPRMYGVRMKVHF